MLQFEELKSDLETARPQLKELGEALGLGSMRNEAQKLEMESAVPGFYDDIEKSQKVLQRLRQLKDKIEDYEKLCGDFEDTAALIDMANEDGDDSVYDELKESSQKVMEQLGTMQLSTLLRGEYDAKNAILSFHAGAGGTEAQDWAEMLYRMYTRWAERHNFKVRVLDFLEGEEAGMKSASVLVEGLNAYGYLKSENGVHRLVRISPFDASGRRHTSFASLEVMPEIDEDIEVEIRPEDLRIDTYRSSGAGGQHVNKTESAIRITHIPTGIVVACQNERSQYQNKDVCMRMLRSKLVQIKEQEHLDKIEDIKGIQKEIAWGSQIRSYVFMPYTLAKDHRTGYETGNINAVMDGDLDGFINAYNHRNLRVIVMDLYVKVGDCIVTSNPADIIKTFALATCVGVTAFARRTRTAGMFHAMLPQCPDQAAKMLRPFSYVDTGLPLFIRKLLATGCLRSDLEFKIYGGASSRAKEDIFKIGQRNLIQVEDIMVMNRLDYHLIDVGGHVSRTLVMEALSGFVYMTTQPF